jgi:hypothetical protein
VAQRAARRASLPSAAAPQWIAVALLCATVLVLSSFLAWQVPRISHVDALHTDFTETLIALRGFVVGDDPYSNAVAIKMNRALDDNPPPPPPGGRYERTFNYLLPPALVYLPMLALDDNSAIIAVRAITVAVYFAALALLVWRFGSALPLWARGGLLLAGVGWWPFLAVILPIVQQAGTVFGMVVLAAWCVERNRWFSAGVLSFLALFKPTESIVLVTVLALWALRSSAPRARLFFAGLAAIGVPTSLLAFAVRPTWVLDWWGAVVALHLTHFSHEVDLPDALAGAMHLPPMVIWAAAAALSIGFVVMLWRRSAALTQTAQRDALFWWLGAASVISLLAIPRAGTYDMVIGLIAWFVALGAAATVRPVQRRAAYTLLTVLLLSVGVLAYRDHAALEFPLWALALLVALWLCRKVALERPATELISPPARVAPATETANDV